MDLIFEGIRKAFWLLVTFDPEVMRITLLSLGVSGAATLISLVIGVAGGVGIALWNFPGKRVVVSLVNTGMGLPPVVVGLFVTIFLWRNGPLGFLGILYTPTAMIFAQAIIATPIVMGISLAAIQQLPGKMRLQILALGATRAQMAWILIREAKLPLLAAIMAGFGGVISEVGASIMVGGNIKGYSRVLTTATVMETSRGNFDIAIALSLILLLLAYVINLALTHIQQREAAPVKSPAIILEARNLRVERGGACLLDLPGLAIEEAEILSLIGPNGAGKTTLLQTLSCLSTSFQGKILFRGKEIGTRPQRLQFRRHLAMVFQEPLLFDTTVYDNVATGLRFRGMGKEEINQRVWENLEQFRIGHLAGRSARTLSGGEAQRTSLARAFAIQPAILFLDEPFAALDPPTRESLIEDLEKILRRTRTTTVFATHDRNEALQLSDRIAFVNRGAILQIGPAAEVMNRPADEFIASFVGVETILAGTVSRKDGDSFMVSVADQEIEAVGDSLPGERVVLCIRPEQVTLSTGTDRARTSARNVFPGRIERIVPLGPYQKVYLDCGFPLVAYVTRHSIESLSLKERTEVAASFKATAIHVVRRKENANLQTPNPK